MYSLLKQLRSLTLPLSLSLSLSAVIYGLNILVKRTRERELKREGGTEGEEVKDEKFPLQFMGATAWVATRARPNLHNDVNNILHDHPKMDKHLSHSFPNPYSHLALHWKFCLFFFHRPLPVSLYIHNRRKQVCSKQMLNEYPI